MERPLAICTFIAIGLTASMTWAADEQTFLSNTRQLLFEGQRSGEGYFDSTGERLIFQSEREPGNPFYQMYLLDLTTGDSTRVSPGTGKTTCGWIHPHGDKVLFASTHDDPEALVKQRQELEERASGQARRYAWSFDEQYEIYATATDGSALRNLTNALGYDAEGSWSPDGTQIAFASNRHAYADSLTEEERTKLEQDASFFMDIYIMNSDGSNVRRLTSSPGYDGGPFFSPDGKRITWRRFSLDGHRAEVFTMALDGGDVKQLTRLGVMSWAPFYHPSGDYIIFTNNQQGYRNFELYIVDVDGRAEPVRVTYTDGFDGLPVFSPDGKRMAWAAARTPNGKSQIFMADWNDAAARAQLALAGPATDGALDTGPEPTDTEADITDADLEAHVRYLASEALEGRLSGTDGERLAGEYVAQAFEAAGLEPAGDDGSFFQPFEFTAGVRLGDGNTLAAGTVADLELVVNRDWRPLAFSRDGSVATSGIVFAGYGIKAPGTTELPPYDSYGDLNITDKWVLVLRFVPETLSPDHRLHLSQYASLNYKAKLARDRGAHGLIVVTGPSARVNDPLVALDFDTAVGTTSLAAISITDDLADVLLEAAGTNLTQLIPELDAGKTPPGLDLGEVELGAHISLVRETRTASNVMARLPAKDAAGGAIVIGAHLDHIGRGATSDSRADSAERGGIHFGADDNASGVAALLEIAQYLSDQAERDAFVPSRDIVFAAWSAEELGTLGSDHFVKSRGKDVNTTVAAYLNMDMVGRLDRTLYLQGVGSSSTWKSQIEKRNLLVGLPVTIQSDSYLPTDSTPFYLAGVPVLSAFTGAHPDYNTPRDVADSINYEGLTRISRLMSAITRGLSLNDEPPDYIAMEKPAGSPTRQNLRAYLGTIPEYGESEVLGVTINGVSEAGPAAVAGVRRGDIIVELGGQTVENIYDYTYALNAVRVGEKVHVVVLREGQRVTLSVTPASRD